MTGPRGRDAAIAATFRSPAPEGRAVLSTDRSTQQRDHAAGTLGSRMLSRRRRFREREVQRREHDEATFVVFLWPGVSLFGVRRGHRDRLRHHANSWYLE